MGEKPKKPARAQTGGAQKQLHPHAPEFQPEPVTKTTPTAGRSTYTRGKRLRSLEF